MKLVLELVLHDAAGTGTGTLSCSLYCNWYSMKQLVLELVLHDAAGAGTGTSS